MKKVWLSFFTLLLLIINIKNVNATSDYIQLGSGTTTRSFVAGVSVPYKVTTNGKYLYSTTSKKKVPQNTKAYFVKNSKYVNGGVAYILKNAYPSKSITGNVEKDYYITQTALWWYFDMTTGSTNLDNSFKNNGADTYGLRQTIKKLAYEGYEHRKDNISYQEPKFVLGTTEGNSMTLKDSYYVSSNIKATTAQNISNYTVSLVNAPLGTKIVSSKGVESIYTTHFKVNADDTFKIKVPVANLVNSSLELKVNAVAEGMAQSSISEYQPSDMNLQSVLLLEQENKTVSSSITLEITSSKVTINAIDSITKKAISGARLVLKNEKGSIVTSWTSTTNSHILHNLPNGNYTIEETVAPQGYLQNKKTNIFTISDTKKEVVVNIEHEPRKVVVNIMKVDQDKQPLSGAVLRVIKSNGEEVARFTSNGNAYVLTNLEKGTYTIEEISAPSGYVKNNEKIAFTIDDNHLSHQITIINNKEVEVPDTASTSSICLSILGIIIIGVGIIFIKKNEKYN